MEKDAGIAENAKLGERQGSVGEVSEPSMMKDTDLSLDGSKASDGNEVFKEVVETETTTIGSEKGVLTEVTGSWEDNENSNLVNEVQKFDEVIKAPDTVKRSGDSGINAELLMSARHSDEKQIDMEKVVKDEKNGLMRDSNDEDGKGDSMETAASAAPAGKTESPHHGYEVNAKLDKFPQNLDGVLSYNASWVETLTSEVPETADADAIEEAKLETSISSELREVAPAPGMPIVKCYIPDMTEVQDSNEAKGGDNGFVKPENGLRDHVNLSETLCHQDPNIADIDALIEKTHEASSDIEDANEVKGSEAGPQPEYESNGCVLHNDEHYVVEDVPAAIQGFQRHQDVSRNTSANLHLGLEDDQFVEQEEKPLVSVTNLIDVENSAMKELNSDNLKIENQNVEKQENKDIAAADTSDMHLVKENSEHDTNSLHILEDSTANLEIAKVEKSHLSSSELPSNIEHTALAQEPVSHNVSVNRKEVKPAANISSPANSVTPRPAGLGHAAPLLGPASQNISENKERGSRPAADTSSENGNLATPARPAGLGRSASPLEVTSRAVQQPRVNGAISPTQNQLTEDPANGEAEEYDETREKLQMIRVKFLRLAHRLGQTPHNVVVAQVLYRLGLAEQLQGRSGGRVAAFSFDRASAMAEQLEASGQEPLDFTCTIMVLGKSGVGKSATMNSIFDEVMFSTDAFQSGTKMVQDIVGTVQGIRVRVIDTPGLLPSWSDQRQNEKILCSVKKFIRKTPPDIVLYLDRLDMQSRDFSDMPLLRTITEIFGQSIWFNAIVVLTHAASAPPEGPNGTTTSYDMFVTQRSHIVQQAIRQAAGDVRLMNPVSLVENHSACRTNRAGQRVLPNGQVWKPHLLLLSFASKILAEANTLLKLQDNPPGKSYAARTRSPPLPFLLSSLLQSRPEVKLPSEQFGDDDAVDDDLDECSDSEDESEYDELPPFNPLTKAQLEKLTKGQRKAYFDELEYREKLFMKKQLKEEKRRRKMMKKMQEAAKDLSPDYGENAEEGTSAEASVPVPMPDLALPASFDSDNPTHRYRSLDSSNPWLVRAVLEPNGWDHDIGYDGLNVERLFVIKEMVPISFSGHISKDKKDANLQMEIASSVRHGKGKATSLGFDMQSVGKDIAYTLRSETRFCNHRVNKAAAGLSATVLGDVLTGGIKLEDKLIVGKRGQLVVSGGAIYGRGDIAYGGSLEATLKDKDHPVGRFLSTLGLSVMDWHGDLAIGCNSQTQIPVGRHTNLIGRFNINNRGSGQFSVRINSSEQLQIALIGIIPLVKKILGYSQQVQYG